MINTGGNKDELLRQLQEKENIIRQLEEVNLSLKHTNDDLNTEVRNLKSRIELLNDEVIGVKKVYMCGGGGEGDISLLQRLLSVQLVTRSH